MFLTSGLEKRSLKGFQCVPWPCLSPGKESKLIPPSSPEISVYQMTRNYVSPQQVLELKCSWYSLPVTWRMMSISKFEYTNGFVFQNTYNLMDNSPFYLNWKVRLVIHQEHFLAFGGRSWLLGWRWGNPSGSNVFSLIIFLTRKRIQVDSLIQLRDISIINDQKLCMFVTIRSFNSDQAADS